MSVPDYKRLFALGMSDPGFLEQIITRIYSEILQSGDVCVDGGAGMGLHTIPMSKLVGTHGKVFAIEPSPATRELLLAERAAAHADNITVVQQALSNEVTRAAFHFVKTDPARSGLRLVPEATGCAVEELEVHTTRLDDLLAAEYRCRFWKLDLEGAELRALQGGQNSMARFSPFIVFENGREASARNYGYTAAEWFSFFTKLGYSTFDLFGRRFAEDIPWYSIAVKTNSPDEAFVQSKLPTILNDMLRQEIALPTDSDVSVRPRSDAPSPGEKSREATKVRLLAFYLPQFHPIPENDQWWGKGFTEWTNVTKAKPLFRGHDQPRAAGELGQYDLRVAATRQAQADLAKAHGIEGFCYWHYWFHGKRLLEKPFNEVLKSGQPDFPFCLAWANESWSRRWLGEDKEILIEQTYSPEDDLAHIRWLAEAFADPRYVRVDGRPLFLVYRPAHLPDAKRTTDTFRAECVRLGLPEPYLVGMDAHCVRLDTRTLGFDITEHHAPQFEALPGSLVDEWSVEKFVQNLGFGILSGRRKIYTYEHAVKRMAASRPNHPYLPCLFTGWDTTPRRGQQAIVMTEPTPAAFRAYLTELVELALSKPPEQRLVFINAWNEWAEGMYLEPDQKHGRLYLEEVRAAVQNLRPTARQTDDTAIKPNSPLVSVVMPTYKHEDYVLQALDSVFAQTFTDYEVIVINDGSPDGTAEILKPLAAAGRIRYFEQANAGQAAARNRGIAEAKGEFIAFLDDDDLWPPDKLEWQVREMEAHPEAALVYGIMETFGSPPQVTHPQKWAPSGWVKKAFVGAGWIRSPGQTLIRTAALRRIGGFDVNLWGTDDWDLYLTLTEFGQFRYLPRIALRYRQHPSNASKSVWRMYLNACRTQHKHLGLFPRPTTSMDWFACRRFIRLFCGHDASWAARDAVAEGKLMKAIGMWLFATWLGSPHKTPRKQFFASWRASLYKKHPGFHRFVRAVLRRDHQTNAPQAAAPVSQPAVTIEAQAKTAAATEVRPQANSMKLLIIHWRIPEPDTNSGDLRLFEIIRILAQAGHEVTVFGATASNPAYVTDLEALGVRCVVEQQTPEMKTGEGLMAFYKAQAFDCAILTPYSTFNGYCDCLWAALPNCALICDTIDLAHVREQRRAELSNDPEVHAFAKLVAEREWKALREADSVWVVTGKERELLSGKVTLVDVVPNIHQLSGNPPPFEDRNGLVFLAGYRHPPNVDAVNWFVAEIYPHIKQALPGITFTIAGSEPPEEFQQLVRRDPRIRVTGYIKDHRHVLSSHRIGLAPLRYGAGMKGKIGEYFACGLPCVTTSIGAEGMGLENGGNTLICDDPTEFAKAVVEAYTTPELWHRLSANGLAYVRDKVSPEALAPAVLDAVTRAVDARRTKQTQAAAAPQPTTVASERMKKIVDQETRLRELDAMIAQQQQFAQTQWARIARRRERMKDVQAKLDRVTNHPLVRAYAWMKHGGHRNSR